MFSSMIDAFTSNLQFLHITTLLTQNSRFWLDNLKYFIISLILLALIGVILYLKFGPLPTSNTEIQEATNESPELDTDDV